MKTIDITDISIHFGERKILESASLKVEAGEMVGLIGPNGAGKSTLMRIAAGLLKQREGSVEILGEPVHPTKMAKKVAYLPQDRMVHWPLTVRNVVALGRLPHLQPWQKLEKQDEEAIHRAMEAADVLALADRPVNELAGGEKALVLIARVLAVEPSLILADEPVAGLDPNHQIQVMQLLKDAALQGKSTLVVLHDLSLAARYCDRLFLMHRGRILDSGAPKDVLSSENLKASYGIEAKFSCDEDAFYVIPWKRL